MLQIEGNNYGITEIPISPLKRCERLTIACFKRGRGRRNNKSHSLIIQCVLVFVASLALYLTIILFLQSCFENDFLSRMSIRNNFCHLKIGIRSAYILTSQMSLYGFILSMLLKFNYVDLIPPNMRTTIAITIKF